MQLISLLGLGFLLGLKHALEADHIAAVSTVVSQTKSLKKSSALGALWGLGHTTTLVLAGIIILAWKLAIPEKLLWSFEMAVGIILVILGAELLLKIRKRKIHLHKHAHDGKPSHIHFHSHASSQSHNHAHRSFSIGLLHGLAGSGVLALLVLATAPELWQGLAFILIFGIGSTLGMLLASTVIALPFLATAKFRNLNQMVQTVAGLASVLVGLNIIYRIILNLEGIKNLL